MKKSEKLYIKHREREKIIQIEEQIWRRMDSLGKTNNLFEKAELVFILPYFSKAKFTG